MTKGLLVGTFDPITNGHVSIVTQSLGLLDHVVVAVSQNQSKKMLFPFDTRLALVKAAFNDIEGVTVIGFDNDLTVNVANELKVDCLIRGIRNGTDLEYEESIAEMNRRLAPNLETVYFLPHASEKFISSTIVREVAKFKGDISQLVPNEVTEALKQIYQNE
ncbi:pantetheine-phosphate adenylyltransferase [Bavariicoccus seileri]|uniref:pantetheine-phosphate adenylyltransferase n=1 Tax=Bavariicoccus seileri TaxID=549685 RepID=UPI003F9304B9